MLIRPRSCYTSVIENLITFPKFKVMYLEVLLLCQCKAAPNINAGMAINKCSTVCIKELSKLMIQIKEWELVEALIEHGTVPDIKCIEIAMEQYNEDRTLYVIQHIEKAEHNICYVSLLSLAIRKEWNDKFVSHCLKQGAKFAAKDIWTVLQWKNSPAKDNLLKLMVSQDGAMDIQNNKGQLPLDFLLEQGRSNSALTLLEFNLDTSKINIIETIKKLKKYSPDKHPIKILSKIIENKKTDPDLLKQELTDALKYAFENNKYNVAAVLIEHGADINTCVDESTTVVHVATKIALHADGK